MDFDNVRLYASAMWDEKSINPKIETGYAFTKFMKKKLVKKFNSGNFNQGNGILKIYYNPKTLIVQHLPMKEKVIKIDKNRMRNGYIVDTLPSVDIREVVKIGGKVFEISESVIHRENFEVSPFRTVSDELVASRQNYKSEKNDVKQFLVKLLRNSLYGEQIRRNIEEKFGCNLEYWMLTECD